MARASRAYTGGRQCVGTPTLNRNNYMSLIRQIRKEREKQHAKDKAAKADISAGGQTEGSNP